MFQSTVIFHSESQYKVMTRAFGGLEGLKPQNIKFGEFTTMKYSIGFPFDDDNCIQITTQTY